MTPAEVRAVIFELPGIEEGFSMGSIPFKVGGKVLVRLGARTGPDDLMLTGVGSDEADLLIEADPAVFHTSPHYRDSSCILARIGALQPDQLRGLLERRWRTIAPKKAVKTRDGGGKSP
jgi:hypothetical protein